MGWMVERETRDWCGELRTAASGWMVECFGCASGVVHEIAGVQGKMFEMLRYQILVIVKFKFLVK